MHPDSENGAPPGISADGRYVVFGSYASNLVENDNTASFDIFVRDRYCQETTMISVASNGTQGEDSSYTPSISDDGRLIAFSSFSNNLVNNDNNDYPDVFVHDYLGDHEDLFGIRSD